MGIGDLATQGFSGAVAARLRRAVDAGAARTGAASPTMPSATRGHRRRPARHPAGGDRSRRSAERRRLGDLRQRRDRGRRQLHPAAGLPRRGSRRRGSRGRRRGGGGADQQTLALGVGDAARRRLQRLRDRRSSARAGLGGAWPDLTQRPATGPTWASTTTNRCELPGQRRRSGTASYVNPGGAVLHGTLPSSGRAAASTTYVRDIDILPAVRQPGVADARHVGAAGRCGRGLTPSWLCVEAAYPVRSSRRRGVNRLRAGRQPARGDPRRQPVLSGRARPRRATSSTPCIARSRSVRG